MRTRKKLILILMVLLSVFQHGLRWGLNKRLGGDEWPDAASSVIYAAETEETNSSDSHCPLVHINTAGMAELQTLPGIGPIYAERIIIERKEQPFREKQDLLSVKGIGEKRLAQLMDLICLYYEK